MTRRGFTNAKGQAGIAANSGSICVRLAWEPSTNSLSIAIRLHESHRHLLVATSAISLLSPLSLKITGSYPSPLASAFIVGSKHIGISRRTAARLTRPLFAAGGTVHSRDRNTQRCLQLRRVFSDVSSSPLPTSAVAGGSKLRPALPAASTVNTTLLKPIVRFI